jgi:hypothetical protein
VSSPKKEYDIDDKPQKSLNEKQQVWFLESLYRSFRLILFFASDVFNTSAGESRSIN